VLGSDFQSWSRTGPENNKMKKIATSPCIVDDGVCEIHNNDNEADTPDLVLSAWLDGDLKDTGIKAALVSSCVQGKSSRSNFLSS